MTEGLDHGKKPEPQPAPWTSKNKKWVNHVQGQCPERKHDESVPLNTFNKDAAVNRFQGYGKNVNITDFPDPVLAKVFAFVSCKDPSPCIGKDGMERDGNLKGFLDLRLVCKTFERIIQQTGIPIHELNAKKLLAPQSAGFSKWINCTTDTSNDQTQTFQNELETTREKRFESKTQVDLKIPIPKLVPQTILFQFPTLTKELQGNSKKQTRNLKRVFEEARQIQDCLHPTQNNPSLTVKVEFVNKDADCNAKIFVNVWDVFQALVKGMDRVRVGCFHFQTHPKSTMGKKAVPLDIPNGSGKLNVQYACAKPFRPSKGKRGGSFEKFHGWVRFDGFSNIGPDPKTFFESFPTHVTQLHLMNCHGIGTLSEIPSSLTKLHVENANGLHRIEYRSSLDQFICLSKCPDLKFVTAVCFAKQVRIESCPSLEQLPRFSNAEKVEIVDCARICEIPLSLFDKDCISTLCIERLDSLASFPKCSLTKGNTDGCCDTTVLTCLKTLKIVGCKSLETIHGDWVRETNVMDQVVVKDCGMYDFDTDDLVHKFKNAKVLQLECPPCIHHVQPPQKREQPHSANFTLGKRVWNQELVIGQKWTLDPLVGLELCNGLHDSAIQRIEVSNMDCRKFIVGRLPCLETVQIHKPCFENCFSSKCKPNDPGERVFFETAKMPWFKGVKINRNVL